MVNMGASTYHAAERKGIESRVVFSDKAGEKFGSPQKAILPEPILTGFDWRWRIAWHDGWAFGCVQQVPTGKPRSLHLVKSRDGLHFEQAVKLDVDHPTAVVRRKAGFRFRADLLNFGTLV